MDSVQEARRRGCSCSITRKIDVSGHINDRAKSTYSKGLSVEKSICQLAVRQLVTEHNNEAFPGSDQKKTHIDVRGSAQDRNLL